MAMANRMQDEQAEINSRMLMNECFLSIFYHVQRLHFLGMAGVLMYRRIKHIFCTNYEVCVSRQYSFSLNPDVIHNWDQWRFKPSEALSGMELGAPSTLNLMTEV